MYTEKNYNKNLLHKKTWQLVLNIFMFTMKAKEAGNDLKSFEI